MGLGAAMIAEEMKVAGSGVQPAPLGMERVDISPKHDEGVLKDHSGEKYLTLSLKYTLLCEIMLNTPEDVQALVSGKLALPCARGQIEALKCVAQASKSRSLTDFEKALTDYQAELQDDPVINIHLAKLYDNFLEQNLL